MSVVAWEKTVLLHHASTDALKRVRELVLEQSFRANEIIFDEGDEGDEGVDVYLLKSGKVELSYLLPTRSDMTVHITTIHPGELFAWSALTGRSTLSARACAIDDSEAFRIPARALRMIMDEIPVFGYEIMNSLSSIIANRLTGARTQLQWLLSS